MLEIAPIWKELPAWVYFVGFIVAVSVLGARFDRVTGMFLERLDEREAPIETKAYLVQVEAYKSIRMIQAYLAVLILLVGFGVLFR